MLRQFNLLAIGAALLVLVACGNDVVHSGSRGTGAATSNAETVGGLQPSPSVARPASLEEERQIHFPRHQYPIYTNWGTDYIFGELMLVGDCLRLSHIDPSETDYTPEGALIIWPAGFRLNDDGALVQVINTDGIIAARVGDNVRVSGVSRDPRPAWMPPPPTRRGVPGAKSLTRRPWRKDCPRSALVHTG